MRKDITPFVIPWWNEHAEDTGFPPIPKDWVPWPDVHSQPSEGVHNKLCFFNSKFANREHGHPIILGVHFGRSAIMNMLQGGMPKRLPYAHAVNLDPQGRIVDLTWGHAQMVGLMIGRAFAIAPTMDLKTYCSDLGFTE